MPETKKPKANILQQMLEDKKAIRQCIQEHGDVKKLAKKRGIKLATPVWSLQRRQRELFICNLAGNKLLQFIQYIFLEP